MGEKMKLLMFHTKEFWYKPYTQDSEEAEKTLLHDCLVVFIHAEEADKNKVDLIDKAAGNIRWLANKNKCSTIVLHSFAHLSESKADPETANKLILGIEEKLKNRIAVHVVPFGRFYEFSIHVLGPSLAKVFKSV